MSGGDNRASVEYHMHMQTKHAYDAWRGQNIHTRYCHLYTHWPPSRLSHSVYCIDIYVPPCADSSPQESDGVDSAWCQQPLQFSTCLSLIHWLLLAGSGAGWTVMADSRDTLLNERGASVVHSCPGPFILPHVCINVFLAAVCELVL